MKEGAMENVLIISRPKRRSRLVRMLRVVYLRALRQQSPVLDRLVPQDRVGYASLVMRHWI